MPLVIFIEANGARHERELPLGGTVMRGAVQGGVPGIPAECGGACSCATCHVYVDPAWSTAVGPPGPLEAEMLEWAVDRRATSRLSCQIEVVAALDGLVVAIPATQA